MADEIHDPRGYDTARARRGERSRISSDPRARARAVALWAARQGWRVFPLVPDGKAPAVKKDWEHAASTNPAAITAWPGRTTGYGIACGPSGLYVVDCDIPKLGTPPAPPEAADATCGLDVLVLLAAEAGQRLARTFSVRSGRGGMHLYYRMPEPELRNTSGRLGWLIDTRGRGGYIVGPGSTVTGREYRTADPALPRPLPAWVASRLAGAGREARAASDQGGGTAPSVLRRPGAPVGPQWVAAALRGEAEKIRTAPTGQGNQAVNDAAYAIGRLVGAGLTSREVAVAALTAALGAWSWDQPSDRTRMLRTLRSALAAGEANPRVVSPRAMRRQRP